MTIDIETSSGCPHCKEHIPYHCEHEEVDSCRWWLKYKIARVKAALLEIDGALATEQYNRASAITKAALADERREK